MSRLHLPRRDFLKGVGAAAAAGPLLACRNRGDTDTGVAPGVDTIVLLMMENRSFDHVFGSLSLVEGRTDVDGLQPGTSNPTYDGGSVLAELAETFCVDPDPPHGWDTSHQQFAEGACSGFVQAYIDRGASEAALAQVMAYQTRERLPISYGLADSYTLCQRWFASLLGPTWPNRLFFHGAQSEGMTVNKLPGSSYYEMLTIWDQLDEAGIEWGYYYTDLPMLALFGRFGERLRKIEEFYLDAAAGTLPAFVMVDPGMAYNDDHPPHHLMLGQIFIGSIHNALAASPQWSRSLFAVTYDEGGGFHDHVAPPKVTDDRAAEGFDQLGFRVPALVAGPYVKRGHVSDVVFDHCAGIAYAQRLFGLEALTARNAAANDLSAVLDEERLAAGDPAPPAELPLIPLTEQEIEEQCSDRSRRRSGQPELEALVAAAAPHLDRTGELDRIGRFLFDKAIELGVCTVDG